MKTKFMMLSILFTLLLSACDNGQKTYTVTWQNEDGSVLEVDRDVVENTMPTYDSATPTKEATAEFSYVFDGWTPEISKVTTNQTYTAKYKSSVQTYTITWKDENGAILEIDPNVPYNTTPTYDGETPTKKSTDEFSFSFAGWDPEIKPATKNQTYTAQYKNSKNTFMVIWQDAEGNVLETDHAVPYGELPSYDGPAPTKKDTAELSYTFAGWSPKVIPATSDQTYTAQFSSTITTYLITWNNHDGTTLFSEKVAYGLTPKYQGSEPTKSGDDEITYVFVGWSPNILPVTTNQTYTAQFSGKTNIYLVKWLNDDGSILFSENVEYGKMPSYQGNEPEKEKTDIQVFVFDGWDTEPSIVTGNQTYTAKYISVDRYYTITWINDDESVLCVDEQIEFNTLPTYPLETPSKKFKEDDSKYYEFTGWTPQIQIVKSDATYKANYSLKEFSYISFETNGGDLISDLKYKETLDYKDLPIPAKDNNYFVGWYIDEELEIPLDASLPIRGNLKLYAQWTAGTFEFKLLENNTYEISKFTPADSETTLVKVPESHLGLDITSIGGSAFTYCTSLTSIVLPNGIELIGDSAFSYCLNLVSITIPNSVISIGASAFRNCSNLKNILLPEYITSINDSVFRGCTKLSLISIPDGVVSIGNHTFDSCLSLTSVAISNNLTSIGNNTFSGCTSLVSITIPNSVISIGSSAFQNCSNLTSVTIPNSVTSIGSFAFSGCTSLVSVTIPNSVTSIGINAFKDCNNLIEIIFPGELLANLANLGIGQFIKKIVITGNDVRIADNAFKDFIKLTNITIPYGTVSIGNYAFSGCTSLTSISLPDSVTSIGNYAFSRCTSLVSIVIPNSVTLIGNSAFFGCTSLESIRLPDSVTSIEQLTFSGCTSLVSITIPNSVTSIGESAFRDCSNLTSVTIPNSVTSIRNYAFSGCTSLTSITIPNSVTSIGTSIFINCSSLSSVTIPAKFISLISNLKKILKSIIITSGSSMAIPNSAFSDFEELESVTILNGVTSIGNYAFSGCKKLTSITIPDSVVAIGNTAFRNCYKLASIILPGRFISLLSGLKSSLVNIVLIGTSIVAIPANAFEDFTKLSSIIMPDSITSIGSSAFRNCESLTKINIPSRVTSVGSAAFAGCTNLSSVFIPDSVITIGFSAFFNCKKLTSIVLPKNLIAIESNAFYGCSGLVSITIPNSVTSIGSRAFYGCSGLVSIVIPNSVTLIGEGAFYGCSGLVSIVIPEGVTELNATFIDCTGLISITIPSSLESIGPLTFYDCNSLTSIIIPDSVTSIGSSAFFGCASLTSIIVPDSVTSIGSSAFFGCTNLEFIYNESSVLIEKEIHYNGDKIVIII